MKKPLTTLIAMALCTTAYGCGPDVTIPQPLKEGSRIALVTPASQVKDELVDSACRKLADMGYQPVVYPHAKLHDYGSYPATDEQRAADLMAAFADPGIDAILCTRGGYGTVRLLEMLDPEVIRSNPKWLVGYSDISDLHAYMHKAGVASIHGPMAKHLAQEPDSLDATAYLFAALTNQWPLEWQLPAHPYNKPGHAKARLVGGNLLTINGLAETPWDTMNTGDDEDVILFVEDIGEEIYAIERVLHRMHLSGSLDKLKGLVIGQFTEYKPSKDFETMEDMIHHWLQKWGYYSDDARMPIVYDFPTGHVSVNYPMIVSAEVELTVTDEGTTFKYTGR